MVIKKAFRSGHALVIALPKQWAEALKIQPGTQCVLTLQNRAIHISRGVITPASMSSPAVLAEHDARPTPSED